MYTAGTFFYYFLMPENKTVVHFHKKTIYIKPKQPMQVSRAHNTLNTWPGVYLTLQNTLPSDSS